MTRKEKRQTLLQKIFSAVIPGSTHMNDTPDEREMIRGVRGLDDTNVREIMIPRVDIIRIPTNATLTDCIAAVTESGHTRIPVYKGNIDRIVGILYSKELLRYIGGQHKFDVKKVMRTPLYVPESMNVAELLRGILRKRVHMAIVVDEYGGVAGIVTLEDIIEEIIGEIHDEFDSEEEKIQALNQSTHLLDVRININDLNNELQLSLPADDFDTLGGFLLDRFGRIPRKRDKLKWENLEFTVEKIKRNQLEKVRMRIVNNGNGKKKKNG